MRISPGLITASIFTAFIVAVLGALIWPLLESPAPPGSARLPAPVIRTVADTSRTVTIMQSEKTALLTYTAVTEQKNQQEAIRQARAREASLDAVRAARAAQAAAAARAAAQAPAAPAATSYPVYAGAYSYSGLKALWIANGGSSALAADAACVAEAESSGNPNAFNGRDIGLWQIDPGNDPGANLYDPNVNAAEAVRLQAAQGWGPWTTAGGCGL